MVPSISDIHSRILAEYDALKTQYKGEEEIYLDALYLSYPEIASIDSDIASLAVKITFFLAAEFSVANVCGSDAYKM